MLPGVSCHLPRGQVLIGKEFANDKHIGNGTEWKLVRSSSPSSLPR